MRDRVGLGRDAERCMNAPPAPVVPKVAKIQEQADPEVAPKRGSLVGDVLKKALSSKKSRPLDGHDPAPRKL